MTRSLALLVTLLSGSVLAAEEDGFVSLFNGRDLSGWTNVNCAPETWSVHDGMIHCTGLPTGALRTPRQYENFILELDWRHLQSGGNSGVFIWASPIAATGVPFLRAIEVQVLDHGFNVPGKNEWYTTHGDVFPIHGSTMKPFGRHNGMRSFPSEERSKGTPEWNHYQIVCSNGVIRLHVNGKEVSGGENCNYRKGYLGLESEGGPIDFRNVRIKELPSSATPADLSAPLDQAWHSLFNGLDLRGWKTNAATAARWRVEGEHILLPAGDTNPQAVLWTEAEVGEAEFIVDCRRPKASLGPADAFPQVFLAINQVLTLQLKLEGGKPGEFQRFFISLKRRDQGHEVTLETEGQKTRQFALEVGAPVQVSLGLGDNGIPAEYMNLYVRETDQGNESVK